MQKRLFCLLTALMMALLCLPVCAETAADALTYDELSAWVAEYKTRALAAQPLNDPTAAEAYSEDGYAFAYDFGVLYMDRPEMTDEAVVRSLVVTSPLEAGPRGTAVDWTAQEVLDAFYNENTLLDGDRSFAYLYLSDAMPSGAMWAWVQRDGQRVQAIQYATHEQLATGGEGYADAGLVYTVENNLVAAIRAYGMDARITEEAANLNLESVQQVAATTGYTQVPLSLMGDTAQFEREDLIFSGLDFLNLTPESAEAALGSCRDDAWMADDTGEHLRTMEFAACTVTFIYDADKQNCHPYMLLIDTDGMEGPRAVRNGDTLATVLNRFRHGEGEYNTETGVEVLYGTEGVAPWGTAEYYDTSATLRYVLVAGTETIVLHMGFEHMQLCEVMLYMAD